MLNLGLSDNSLVSALQGSVTLPIALGIGMIPVARTTLGHAKKFFGGDGKLQGEVRHLAGSMKYQALPEYQKRSYAEKLGLSTKEFREMWESAYAAQAKAQAVAKTNRTSRAGQGVGFAR